MNDFVYDIPVTVFFGKDQLCHLGDELKKYGTRVLLTYGGGSIKKNGLYDRVVAEIEKAGLKWFELSGIAPNPKIDSVREGVEICKKENIDVLLAVGGGSTIDATKYIAAGACVSFDPWKFFSDWAPIEKSLPVLTVLTIAATGSEMDPGGVITNPETREKVARVDPHLLPKVSFLDPTNTYTVNAYQTACGSADIMSHVMELYFTLEKDLYLLDCFMESILKTVIRYAPIALKEPENYEARANLMWASSWAINGLINGGKQIACPCHAMEHELSAFYDITHGLGLAILTTRWMKYCLNETTLPKFVQFGVNVFEIDPSLPKMEIACKGIEMLSDFWFHTLGLQSTLTEIGIGKEHFAIMAQKACGGGMLPGIKPLTQEDIEKVFAMCL